MAAPSSIKWGSIVKGSGNPSGRQGRIGIYTNVTSTNTQTTVNVQVWFWTIYSCDDGNFAFYYNAGTSTTSATSKVTTACSAIKHTVASGSGWSTSNQTKLYEKTYTYNRGTSATTYKVYAKFSGIDILDSAMNVNTSYTVPKLASYTVSYNANGGSGAPSGQTKWYGKTLTLSSTKPTRTGYSFQGWATSASGSKAYDAGGSYTANAAVTLYAVWKANTYTVSFNANGGSGAPSNQTKTYGVTLKLSSTKPTRANYTFLGWSKSSTATSATYTAGANFTDNAKTTLYAVWKLAYTKPSISSITVTRCDSDGNTSDDGTRIRVKFNWSCFYAATEIKIAASHGGIIDHSITASTLSNSVDTILAYDFDPSTTYTISITVTDSGGSTTVSRNVLSTGYTIDFRAGGKGIAIGKAAEADEFDVNMNSHFRKKMVVDNNIHIYANGPAGQKIVFTGQNDSGDTYVGYGNYDARSGETRIYGHDVLLYVSNPSKIKLKPYFRKGDTLSNITIKTAGYVTNSGQDVTFTIPLSVPVIGKPSISVTGNYGLVLRQGSKYTHGSTADTGVHPDSYTGSITEERVGINIVARFSDTTNVTNNDAIGVYWNGTIVFG